MNFIAEELAGLTVAPATAGWVDSAPNLVKNLGILSSDEIALAKMLLQEGQKHVFYHWPEPGVDDEKKKAFFDQVAKLNSSYPGGLVKYMQNARELLADSKSGKNPYDGFVPSVPSGEVLTFADDNFIILEETGIREGRRAAFVLVAGGLGERLGYKGIKVALPLETTTGTCFLQHYIESILALQESSCKLSQEDCDAEIPLVIMTSDDTHASTLNLLESNSYFGMKPTQVKLLKQEKVACLDDNDARLALDPNDKYKIQTKPHGHGDVHALLYSCGLLNIWKSAGFKWVVLFQDTNGLFFKAITASLGVSSTKGYHVNSLAVPRKAKEAIGGITKLTHTDGRTMVINVEYNQLDPLLRATGHADGDVNSETGFSPFPGNINQLILELDPYIEELNKTRGAISEFVNPKYKDSTKTSFKSSTRLECMMQDYPKTLPSSAKVGFTVMDTWLAYAPVKNKPEDAAKNSSYAPKIVDRASSRWDYTFVIEHDQQAVNPSTYCSKGHLAKLCSYICKQVPKGNPYHSATSGEMAIYRANSLILKKAGIKIDDPVIDSFNGQEVEVWSRITWSPKWALTIADVKRKVQEGCFISQRSTLVINGQNIYLDGLSLDGTLIVSAINKAEVKVVGIVRNKGWVIEHIDHKDDSIPEEIRTRGFRIQKIEQLERNFAEPGSFSTGS